MKISIVLALLIGSVFVQAKSDISFNSLIEKGMVERQELRKDVSALIEQEKDPAASAELVEFISDEVDAVNSRSKLVDSDSLDSDNSGI